MTSLPPLGCLPLEITLFGFHSDKCVSRLNGDAQNFNNKLNAAVNSLAKQLPQLKIAVFDVYTPLDDLATNPSKYGTTCLSDRYCSDVIYRCSILFYFIFGKTITATFFQIFMTCSRIYFKKF